MTQTLTFLSSALPLHDPLWITAIGGLITACGGVAGSMVGAISAVSRSHRETEKKLDSIRKLAHDAKEQTANNHGMNLRDDIDKLDEKLDLIAHTQSLLGKELADHGQVLDQLQAAQGQARFERMAIDSQAHAEHGRIWEEIDQIKNRL